MVATRPAYLAKRSVRYFDAELYRASAGGRNEWGEWRRGELGAAEEIQLYDYPPQGRERALDTGGADVYASRTFHTYKQVFAAQSDRDGDLLLIDSEWYRVVAVARTHETFKEKDTATGQVRTVTRYEYQGRAERLDVQPEAGQEPEVQDTGNDEFQRELRRYIAMGSGLLLRALDGGIIGQMVIPANGAGVSPEGGVYATVLVRESAQEGEPYYADRAVQGETGFVDQAVGIQRLHQVSIQFHREGADIAAQRLLDWVESPAGKLAEETYGFVLVPPHRRVRADTVEAGAWEERSVVDMQVRHIQTVAQRTGTIEEVPLELRAAGFEYAADLNASD